MLDKRILYVVRVTAAMKDPQYEQSKAALMTSLSLSNISRVVAVMALCLWCVCDLYAQDDSIDLRMDPNHLGLAGFTRPGSWTPMLLTLENRSADPRKVLCQWVFADSDGDEVSAQRGVTLSPQRTQQAWLYGIPTIASDRSQRWLIRVIDEKTQRHLASLEVPPGQLTDQHEGVVGVTGSLMLGLSPYTSLATQHERCKVLRDVAPAFLPDRWYGMALLQALVWTPQGTDPSDPAISPSSHRAVRNWVRRGGHLVVILPLAGGTWFESPLASLLPAVRTYRVSDVPIPAWVGRPQNNAPPKVDVKVLEPAADNVSVLLRDRAKRPLVVTRRYGFGAVTLVGIDLTDAAMVRAGLPNGPSLWEAVFGWQSPAYTKAEVERGVKNQDIVRPDLRRYSQPDEFIPRKVAMYGTASPALLTALVMFTLYWAAAGPVGFAMLKRRGLVQHSWIVFLAVVAAFSAIAWGTAALLRPINTAAEHFTVLDVDAESGLVRARAWLSLFASHRGKMKVAIGDADTVKGQHTLASPGFDAGSESGFIDQQQYTIEALSPDRADIPFRATAKQLHVDYLRRRAGDDQPLAESWRLPRRRLELQHGRLVGTVTHGLPDDLNNLLVVYCPGDGDTPVLKRHKAPWPAGQPLDLAQLDLPHTGIPLVEPFQYDDKGNRLWKREGYLGEFFASQAASSWSGTDPTRVTIADDEIVQAAEILSFYNMLPPPDYRTLSMLPTGPANLGYRRQTGRALDLTAILATRCVILVGYLEKGPMPVPMTLEGQPFDSTGWTVLRWICPVD